MSSFTTPIELIKNTVNILDETTIKLSNFLQNEESVIIKNPEFVNCYNLVVKCCDETEEFKIEGIKKNINKKKNNNSHNNNNNLIEDQDENGEKALLKWYLKKLEDFVKFLVNSMMTVKTDVLICEKVISNWEKFSIYVHWMKKVMILVFRIFLHIIF